MVVSLILEKRAAVPALLTSPETRPRLQPPATPPQGQATGSWQEQDLQLGWSPEGWQKTLGYVGS